MPPVSAATYVPPGSAPVRRHAALRLALTGVVAAAWVTTVQSQTPAAPPPAAGTAAASAQPGASAAARPAPARTSDDMVELNFVNADLEQTVRAIAQYSGRQIVVDPRVKGTLTLVTERPVDKLTAFQQLLAALRLQGYALVDTGGVARVVPEADAKLQAGRVLGPGQGAPRGDQIVTQVFQLQFESATNMVNVLRPLISPNNTIAPYPANNTLVITDYADNLRRIEQILRTVDQAGLPDAEVITLRHGLAGEIAAIASRTLDDAARVAGAVDVGQRVTVLAEPRTNTVIVRAGSRARLASARLFIEQLDKPSATPGNINVVYLRNAQATRLAQTLRAVIAADPNFSPQVGGTLTLSGQPGGSMGGGTLAVASLGGAPGAPGPAPAPASGAAGGVGGPLAGMIQADPATNALIITAPEPLYRNLRAIIDKLDARPAQVVIESLILEIGADKAAEFGFQWQALSGLGEDSSGTRVIGGTNFGSQGQNILGVAANPTSVGQGLNVGVVRGRITLPVVGEIVNLGVLARALETDAGANILSMPTIQTLDNEEARFLVGQNVPFITGQFSNTTAGSGAINPFQTFERRDVGIQLRVKPQISEGGVIRLAIYQEVSSVQPGTTLGGLITNKRSIDSNVLVDDGGIVVLGGLIEDRVTNSASQVPVLGNIPYLGALFRYESRERRKTNLMVFLRPRVVRDEATSSAYALERYDYLRGQMQQGARPDAGMFQGYEGPQLPSIAPGRPAAPAAPAANPPAAGAAPGRPR